MSTFIIQDHAVIRKGREHYVCKKNLRENTPYVYDTKMKQILEQLQKPNAKIDLAEIDGLTAYIKRKIAVPERCHNSCKYRDTCAYLRFRTMVGSPSIDIQVCNHNYLLANALHRADEFHTLIPNHQSVIIDEAHKFLAAARSMYSTELSDLMLSDLKDDVLSLKFKHESVQTIVRKTAKKLSNESNRLFRELNAITQSGGTTEDTARFAVEIDIDAARHLRNMHDISGRLLGILTSEIIFGSRLKAQIIRNLTECRNQTAVFVRHETLICWTQKNKTELRLCAIPKNLNKRLYNDLWNSGVPTIFTSGTLSANGDFSHIKRTLGLEQAGMRLTETSKPSPFNYQKNAMLYISENIPFPDRRNKGYIAAVTDEIERLILAAHGHTAVLFTSYNTMGLVYTTLNKRTLPFPMFRLDKGGVREIDRFKKSGNGVLFASGALWEGIDIPGDALSMLIIVKLPFAVPDPISEYEQTLYKDMSEYKRCVIVPEMLIKLKQGFGRLIRTEKDTGVVAILDSRISRHGKYRKRVLDALPHCRVTDNISDVDGFIHTCKPPDYFI